jgi:hypothetical protein
MILSDSLHMSWVVLKEKLSRPELDITSQSLRDSLDGRVALRTTADLDV